MMFAVSMDQDVCMSALSGVCRLRISCLIPGAQLSSNPGGAALGSKYLVPGTWCQVLELDSLCAFMLAAQTCGPGSMHWYRRLWPA